VEDGSDAARTAPLTIAAHVMDRAADYRPGLLFEGDTWTWAEVVAEAAE